jgi:hypothetical protein
MGKLFGKNSDWSTFKHAACPNGTWSNCASSVYNNGDNCRAQLWNAVGFKNTAGTSPLVLARQTGVPRLAGTSLGGGSWDHAIRSNNWICP